VVLLDNKQKSDKVEVDVPSSPRSQEMLLKADREKREKEIKETIDNTSDLPF
jgi:hypothetical protein